MEEMRRNRKKSAASNPSQREEIKKEKDEAK
jgi:hypothetical protein